ncbi:MAG: glycosyltransferase family 2 protein [Gammaproteobacteria bacterium]|nr:glycosyltransferase family 2 protein [Gammaproteobacteria bacterium]
MKAEPPMEPRHCMSIVVPAFNEEACIELTLSVVSRVAQAHLAEYEILVVDDGSSDNTQALAAAFAEGKPNVHVHRQPTNQGVGAAYLTGLVRAKYPWITVVPGDNAFAEEALKNVFSAAGTSDLVVSYRSNMEVRTPLRRVLSVICTRLMRLATGAGVRDAHSMFVFPVSLARAIRVQPGYGYHIDSLGRLLVLTDSFLEVPAPLNPRPDASSGVMRFGVVSLLGITMLRLMWWRLRHLLRLNDRYLTESGSLPCKKSDSSSV